MRTRFFTFLAALGCMIATIVIEGIPSINKKNRDLFGEGCYRRIQPTSL